MAEIEVTLTRGDWGGKIPPTPTLENRRWGSEGEKEKRGEEREEKGRKRKKGKVGKRKEKKEGKRRK